jgi:hypothetical protein
MNDINEGYKEETCQINIDEILSNLEIYIELLQETVNKFKNIKKPKYFETKEFMLEYVTLEEKILDMFDSLVTKKVDKKSKKQLEILVNQFNQCWGIYQDTWGDATWLIYENTKKKDKKININSYLEEENRYLVEVKFNYYK